MQTLQAQQDTSLQGCETKCRVCAPAKPKKTLADIQQWGRHPQHKEAIRKGKKLWYKKYTIRICKVEY